MVFVKREDGLEAVGALVCGIDGMSFVGEGLGEDFEEVWAAPGDFVIEGERADDFVIAAFLCLFEAKKGDDVAAVGMEGEFFTGIGAAGAGVVILEAGIADGEDAFAIGGLGEGCADGLREGEEKVFRVGFGELVDGESAEEGGAGAMFEGVLDGMEFLLEGVGLE